RGFRVGSRHGLVRRIEAGDGPTLLSEINRVAALSHADVECLTGSAASRHLDEKRVRLGVEGGRRRGENAVPPFDFEPPGLFSDDANLMFDLSGGQTLGRESLSIRV